MQPFWQDVGLDVRDTRYGGGNRDIKYGRGGRGELIGEALTTHRKNGSEWARAMRQGICIKKAYVGLGGDGRPPKGTSINLHGNGACTVH